MLEDHKRTSAYYRACVNNRKCFEGKVVLDVGTGSGILAIFAAQAGAKKVYAVEATDMAKQARTLVEHNGFGDVIEVIQGTIETVQIPEKVDILISEWMGYFLLRGELWHRPLGRRRGRPAPPPPYPAPRAPALDRDRVSCPRMRKKEHRTHMFEISLLKWSSFH